MKKIYTPTSAKSSQIGLFYFLWLGEHGRHKPYDISKITAEHPDAGYHPPTPTVGAVSAPTTTGASRSTATIIRTTSGWSAAI